MQEIIKNDDDMKVIQEVITVETTLFCTREDGNLITAHLKCVGFRSRENFIESGLYELVGVKQYFFGVVLHGHKHDAMLREVKWVFKGMEIHAQTKVVVETIAKFSI